MKNLTHILALFISTLTLCCFPYLIPLSHAHDVALYPARGWNVQTNREPKCPSGGSYANMGHWGTISVSHVPKIVPWDGEVFTGGTYRNGERIKRTRYSMRNGAYVVDMINGDYMLHPKFNPAAPHFHKFTPSNGDNAWYGYYQEPLSMMCVDEPDPPQTPDPPVITTPDPPIMENTPDDQPNTDDTGSPPQINDEIVDSTPVVGGGIPDGISSTEDGEETGEIPSVQPTDEMLPEIVAEQMIPKLMTYTHIFPAGVSFQHIPLDITDFNGSGVAVNSVPGVFDQLDDLDNSVALLIASRGISGWTYVTSPNYPALAAIWKSIGFVAVMHEETKVEITGTFGSWTGESDIVYSLLYLRSGGLTLRGVPVQSDRLQTVGDFYTVFPNIISVKGIDPDIELDLTDTPIRVKDDWFVELDKDVIIDGTTSYLIESEGAAQRAIWGVPWTNVPSSSAAPPAVQWSHYKKMATTWGQLKAVASD